MPTARELIGLVAKGQAPEEVVEGRILTEARYPPQYDAEFALELSNFMASISRGGLERGLQVIRNLEKIHMVFWDYCFGDDSPWAIRRGRGGKSEVYWDDEKSAKLGL